jgi:hypothetical protein
MRGSLETKRARTPLECTAKTAPRSPETAFFQFHTGADFQKSFGCRPDAVERLPCRREKYCHNGGMAFAHQQRWLPGVQDGDHRPFRRTPETG